MSMLDGFELRKTSGNSTCRQQRRHDSYRVVEEGNVVCNARVNFVRADAFVGEGNIVCNAMVILSARDLPIKIFGEIRLISIT